MVSIDQKSRHALVSALTEKIQNALVSTSQVVDVHDLVERAIDDVYATHYASGNKHVHILLSDLRGFTAMSECYSARAVMEVLNHYVQIMSPIIVKHGGVIDKFMGDSIMALFGAPESIDDALIKVLTCAIEMQWAMDELNKNNETLSLPKLYMGIGINSGNVVAGELGSKLYSEYTVIGSEVNLVSRIEAQSLRGQILIGENTYALAKDIISTGDINEVYVKGRVKSVKMYELLSINRPDFLMAPCRNSRKSPRVQVDFPTVFYCVSGKKVDPVVNCGRIVDMGYSGFQTVTALELRPLSEVKLAISPSLMSQDAKYVYAKVLRGEKFEGEYKYSMEFTSIDPMSQTSLKKMVDQLVSD